MPYKCFLVESSGIHVLEASIDWPGCAKTPWPDGRHRATREVVRGTEAEARLASRPDRRDEFEGPCEFCGIASPLLAPNVINEGLLWRRADTGATERRISNFGVGAMWLADWYRLDEPTAAIVRYGYDWDNQYEPPLLVKTPGGDWNVDSRAHNCTLKDDRRHRCWVRHGAPPNITVDKVGLTCAAGAGSIQAGSYHGFLRNGYLT